MNNTTSLLHTFLRQLFEGFNAWLSGALVVALAAVLMVRETQLLDWRFQARYIWQPERKAASNLVVIALLAEKGRDSAVTPRDYLARLVRTIAQYQPAVIALDYDFDDEDLSDPHFAELRAAVAQAGNVVLPCLLLPQGGQYEILSLPPAELLAVTGVGYSTLFEEAVYELPLHMTLAEGTCLPSFALAAVAGYVQPEKFFPLRTAHETSDNIEADSIWTPAYWERVLARNHCPNVGKEPVAINYFGKVDGYQIALQRAEEFLKEAEAGSIAPDAFANKVVLVGSAFPLPDGGDQFHTPFFEMFGVEVQANIISMLLSGDYLQRLGWGWTIAFVLLALVVVVRSWSRLALGRAVLVIAGYLLCYVLAGFVLFISHALVLPLALPVQAGLFAFFFTYAWQQYRRGASHAQDFLDFEILAEAAHVPEHYRLRLIAAPTQAGDAKAEVHLAQSAAFAQMLKRLERGHVDVALLKNFGKELYEFLFSGELATAFARSLTQARMLRTKLRLRLRLDAPELRTLPWEYLYDPRHNHFLAANAQVLLSRYVESTQPRRALEATNALNVLIVLSQPEAASLAVLGMTPLDAAYEKELITPALEELATRAELPLRYTILEHAVVDELRTRLREDYHVLHFIGHSTFRAGTGQIVLENEAHEAVLLDEDEFSDLFLNSTDMRLVVLNSCKSAATSALPTVSGMAYKLIERGVPAIVAMQYAIDDAAAARFAREFYRSLASSHPVDLALAHARLVLRENKDRHDFGIPVLFMRAKDGRIV